MILILDSNDSKNPSPLFSHPCTPQGPIVDSTGPGKTGPIQKRSQQRETVFLGTPL